MARLYRPHIPLSIKVQVAMRGLLARDVNAFEHSRREGESLSAMLARLLNLLAASIGCEPRDLRLDHDPPLAARPRGRNGLGRKTCYEPDANDPAHLFYRPHGAQFEGSHDVKTRIRGDHGQYSDLALIKRERRRNRKKQHKKTGFRKANFQRKPKSAVRPKHRWAKRKLKSRGFR